MRVTDIATPALLVDADVLDRNIATMAKALPGPRLRPHVKAHKCTGLARRQAAAGHRAFTVTPDPTCPLPVAASRRDFTINAIAPGAIWTPMVENSMKQLDPENPRKAAEEFIQVNPSKRYGEAPEIAAVVAFLLSDDASYVNATVVPIDGGQSAAY